MKYIHDEIRNPNITIARDRAQNIVFTNYYNTFNYIDFIN